MILRTSSQTLCSSAVMALGVFFLGCNSSISDSDDGVTTWTKPTAAAVSGLSPQGEDLCDLGNWYGDGECDAFCPNPDPDCSLPHCPDRNDPSVRYLDIPGACTTEPARRCETDEVEFNSPDCGCGCVKIPPELVCGPMGSCPDGKFCDTGESKCGTADVADHCKPIPDACPKVIASVCGCDGKTYTNECFAHMAGQGVAYEGECNSGGTCSGLSPNECPAGQYCDRGPSCGTADLFGTCTPIPSECPAEDAPVCGCDGVTYSNACAAQAASASIAHVGACASGGMCGGFAQVPCPDGHYCELGPTCGGDDSPGVCLAQPQACPFGIVDPVCGCDGITYLSECDAHAAGQTVASKGPCGSGTSCSGNSCPAGEYCIEQACGTTDMAGTCGTIPQECTAVYQPVCGCDHKTYGNACQAAAAGVNILPNHLGPCPAQGSCYGDDQCSDTQFCDFGDQCLIFDVPGTCTERPAECDQLFAPVCGCDQKEYPNACEAHRAGVSVLWDGSCE